MGSIINVGNQKVFFNYHKALTGANMNEYLQERLRPGIIEGMSVTKQSDTSILLGTGSFVISDGSKVIVVKKSSSNSIIVDSSKDYIIGRYTYSTIEDWYVEFLNVDVPLANDIIFRKIIYVGGNVDSFDDSENDNAWRAYDNDLFITASGHNAYFKDLIESGAFGPTASGNKWLELVVASWLDESANAPIEETVGTKIPVLSWDNVQDRYLYFLIRTGAAVDIDFRLKFTGDAVATGQVRLRLEYKLLSSGLTNLDSLTFSEFTEEDIAVPAGPYTYQETTTTDLKLPSVLSAVSNKLIICRLYREYANVSDTYTGNFQLIQMLPNT